MLHDCLFLIRNRNLEGDIIQLKEFHEQDMKTYRAKIEAHIESIKQEHEITKQKVLIFFLSITVFF